MILFFSFLVLTPKVPSSYRLPFQLGVYYTGVHRGRGTNRSQKYDLNVFMGDLDCLWAILGVYRGRRVLKQILVISRMMLENIPNMSTRTRLVSVKENFPEPF